MIHSHWLGILCIGILCATALFGCQQRPVVPTIAPEPTEPVIVVVVTATSQPTLQPTSTTEPTITPIPTLPGVITGTLTATLQATSVAQATRAPATAAPRPTQEQVQPTAAAVQPTNAPSNFPAPVVFAPEDKAFRDGDTLKFEFASVGKLAPEQCYRFDMTLGNPTGPGGAGDYWVGYCGDQSNAGDRLIFNIKPGRFRDEPNYGTLLVSADAIVPPTPQYVMRWFVSVVRVTDSSDSVHPKTEALSAISPPLQNSFFR